MKLAASHYPVLTVCGPLGLMILACSFLGKVLMLLSCRCRRRDRTGVPPTAKIKDGVEMQTR